MQDRVLDGKTNAMGAHHQKPKLKQARENMAAEMRQRLNCRLRTFNVSSTLIPLTLSGGLVLDEHQGHHAEHSRDQRDPK
jgi:hypothetical protein